MPITPTEEDTFDKDAVNDISSDLERAAILERLQASIKTCTKCVQCGYITQANPVFSGTISSRVMLIGQAPGVRNAEEDYPFNNGQAGKRLFQWLAQAGWSEEEFRQKHYISSVTRCYPGKDTLGKSDRVPSLAEQELCSGWRNDELKVLGIKVMILMGKLAIGLYLDSKLPLEKLIGNKYEFDGRVVVPIPHPSGASTWHLKPANRILLERAINYLRDLRVEHDL